MDGKFPNKYPIRMDNLLTQLIGSKKNPKLLKKRFKLTVTLTKITNGSVTKLIKLKYRPIFLILMTMVKNW